LLSFFPIYGGPIFSGPSVGWALDELFADQPNAGALKTPRAGITDVSLSTFLEREWPANRDTLLQSPRLLAAAAVFNGVHPGQARVNYNAHPANLISHLEVAWIEAIFGRALGWE